MEEEACYVFKPKAAVLSKKRSREENTVSDSLDRRKRLCRREWAKQEKLINDVTRETNARFLGEIRSFMSSTETGSSRSKIPTAIVLTGSTVSSELFRQLEQSLDEPRGQIFIALSASDAPNLRTLLRTLIFRGTQGPQTGIDADVDAATLSKMSKLLNYDLEILHEWCKARSVAKVVVALQDSEGFDAGILTDLIILLRSWLDRIPVTLLVGVATSLNMFHDRLPTAAISCLEGQVFDGGASMDVIEKIFESMTSRGDLNVRMGPAFADVLLQRTKDHMQSTDGFIQSLKYACMAHFYGNPLSELCEGNDIGGAERELLQIVRELPSFQSLIEGLLHKEETTRVRAALESDQSLINEISYQLQAAKYSMAWITAAIHLLISIRKTMSMKPVSFSTLYVKCLSGELATSPILRETLLATKTLSSEQLALILPQVVDTLITMPASEKTVSPDDFRDVQDELAALEQSTDPSLLPLRSIHGATQENFKTAVVSQRVQLNKRKSQLPEHVEEYSKLLASFHDLLESYLKSTFIGMRAIPLHEIIFFDVKSVHRDAFTPSPRFAIERALSSPHDYLGCQDCADTKNDSTHTQPATAILYQLYLESGPLINAYDLWTAFSAAVGRRYDEETTMALFFESLAEMKYMGMVRSSRKRGDHISRVMWKGL